MGTPRLCVGTLGLWAFDEADVLSVPSLKAHTLHFADIVKAARRIFRYIVIYVTIRPLLDSLIISNSLNLMSSMRNYFLPGFMYMDICLYTHMDNII